MGNVSADARDLIKSMLILDPNERPSALQLLNDKWFVNVSKCVKKCNSNGITCPIIEMQNWNKTDIIPTAEQMIGLKYIFQKMNQCLEERSRILIHCETGVDQSATLLALFRVWRREINHDTVVDWLVNQRYLRRSVISKVAQYNYLRKYINIGEKKKYLKNHLIILNMIHLSIIS